MNSHSKLRMQHSCWTSSAKGCTFWLSVTWFRTVLWITHSSSSTSHRNICKCFVRCSIAMIQTCKSIFHWRVLTIFRSCCGVILVITKKLVSASLATIGCWSRKRWAFRTNLKINFWIKSSNKLLKQLACLIRSSCKKKILTNSVFHSTWTQYSIAAST